MSIQWAWLGIASLALSVGACDGGSRDSQTGDGGGNGGGDGSGDGTGCVDDGAPFDPAALEAEVRFLAADELRGRQPGEPEDLVTRMHIAERFACLGLTPVEGSYQQEFVDSRGRATANVVGILDGGDPAVAGEIIVIGAHHDHLGVRQGKVYNGANDNASGVATVLAVAQAVRQRPQPPRRTIVFATFGSEELGLEGSYHYADHPPAGRPIEDVVYMINLDMIGTYFNDDQVYAFGSFSGTPARDALDELLPNHPDLTVELGASAVEVEGEGDSDYDAFCQKGIPYLYFFTEDDDCYHRPCDDTDRLDYLHLAAIGQLTAEALLQLADSPMDLPAARQTLGCGER
jgi:hypothetical protein